MANQVKKIHHACPIIGAIMLVALLSTMAFGAVAPSVTFMNPIIEGVSTPVRLASDPVGNFYVTDPRGGGVLKYGSAGNLLQVMATARPPQGIAVTSSGSLVVSEGDYAALLDKNGTELRKLGIGAGQFKMANGITIDASGLIYVVDSLDNCVQVFTASGDFKFRFGTTGSQPGQFSMPTGIAFEKGSNQLAIADTMNGRIQFFGINGTYLKAIGTYGSGPLKFTYVEGIAFEYSAGPSPALLRMYAVDTFQGNLQVIDPAGSGTYLGTIGGYGNGPGQLIAPMDVLFDQTAARLIVTSGYGNLALYGIDQNPAQGDIIPPALTLNQFPATVTAATLLVSGTVEAGATVAASVNGAPSTAAMVVGTDWYVTVFLTLGTNTITVTATDQAGNATTKTAGTTALASQSVVTIDPVTKLTNNATQKIAGTRTSGATISVAVSTAASPGTITYPTATSWSSTIAGLSEGDNVITVTAATASGSSSAATTITLDTAPPALDVSTLADGSNSASRVLNISGIVADPHLDKVTVNGTPARIANGLFTTAVTLANGANSVTVTASDLAGNTGSDTRTFFFDPAKPLVTIVAPADGLTTRTAQLDLNGTVSADCTVTVNGVPATISGSSWNAAVTLSGGLNTVVVTATDLAGTTSTMKRTLILDTARPDVAIGTPDRDIATSAGSLAMSGTAAANSTLTCAVNGVAVPLALTNGSYALTAQFPGEGTYAVTVTATDNAGNTSVATRNVIMDKTPPAMMINQPDSPAPAVLNGVADPKATVTAADKNGAVGSIVTTGATWSLDLSGTGYDPATLVISAVDAAGNTMARTLANTAPNGDLDGNGTVTISDALRALRIVVGLVQPTASDYMNGDVGLLVGGGASLNGTIDVTDALLILRRVVGLETW